MTSQKSKIRKSENRKSENANSEIGNPETKIRKPGTIRRNIGNRELKIGNWAPDIENRKS